MTKRNNQIIGIVILMAIIVGVIWFINSQPKVNTEDNFMSLRLYDADKNLITGGTLSIVEGISGVAFLDITITATNTGDTPLTCNLVTLTPTALDNAVTRDSKTLPVTPNKVSWTSDLIDVVPLEGGITTFSATVRCSYNTGTEIITLGDQIGTLDVSIINEGGTQGFNVNLALGGDPDTFCGDSTCDADETASTCPADCATTSNVNFRTTDLSYVSGSAIGYSSSCGSALTGYGYSGQGLASGETCASYMPTAPDGNCGGGTLTLSNLPGGFKAGGASPVMYSHSSDSTLYCICDDDGANALIRRFDSDDEDAGDVDTNPLSIDSAKELAC